MTYKPKFTTIEAAFLTLAGRDLAVVAEGEVVHVVQRPEHSRILVWVPYRSVALAVAESSPG